MIEKLHFKDIVKKTNYIDSVFAISKIKHHGKHRPRPMHTHDYSELCVVSGGNGEHIIENNSYPITNGDVFAIKGDISHQLRNKGNLELYIIFYQQNNFPVSTDDLKKMNGFQSLFVLEPFYRKQDQFKNKLHLNLNKMVVVQELLDNIIKETNEKLTGYITLAKALFTQLIFILSREYENSINPDTKEIFRMANAITYIEKNYLEPIKLKDVVSRSFVSERHFLRLFKQNYNTSPFDYIIQLRIKHACDLMKNKALTISETAFESGFNDSNYFTRKFKQIKGITPKEYIKTIRL